MLKIPFGLDAFAPLRSRGYYYFDKTEGLRDLIEQGERYFLARPSGYGKTLTLSTLAAMFEGKIELFQGLAAQNYVKDQSKKTHPVLSFDLSSLNFAPEGCFEEFLNKILAAQARKFGLILPEGHGLQSNLYELLHQVFDLHGELVILIDNYESPFQANLDDSPELFKRHRIIQQFYQLLQSNNALFRFLLILGQEPYTQFGLYATLPGLS
ncbi:MAG: AAA family ATPase, partial [Desulfovibrio sp.]|nr:AAA family ATPase [Desulfovibrio sp.]